MPLLRVIVLILTYSCLLSQVAAQGYTLTLEEHATDIVPGFTTYRMYIDMVNPDDHLTSIYGGDTAPLSISTSENSFFNSPFGGATANSINPAFLAFFPDLAADSWVTIGIDQLETGDEVAISTLEDPAQPFIECFIAGSELDGQNVLIDSSVGGAWYVLNGTPNGLPDENMRVLFLQMTTAGEICGTINAQILENGVGSASLLFTFSFCGPGTFSPVIEGAGCTDETACNFNPTATEDDGSCTVNDECGVCGGNGIPEGACDCYGNTLDALGLCGGSCLADDDNNGICDAEDVLGCMDAMACNFTPLATADDGSCEYDSCFFGCTIPAACNYNPASQFEDGSCEYPEEGYDCAGACLNDSDGDGVCDEFEVSGCVDPAACNYVDPAIVTDEEECTYPSSDYYDCDGNCLNDIDGDGICDEFSVYGCTDPAACNYDMNATDESGDCIYPDECGVCGGNGIGPGLCDCAGTAPDEGYDCEGVCLNDEDGDGVCDEFEVLGCTDANAFNFNEEATEDDGCEYLNDLPVSWAVIPTPSSAVLIGAVELDGIPAGEEDWVGAFTEGGACAGLAQPTMTELGALISLIIYGDDDLTEDTVEGLLEGEPFSLQYFDATTGESYQYHAENGQWLLTGWTNMNGAPLPGYNDPTTLYSFTTEPYDPLCGDPLACNYEVGGEETASCVYPEPGLDCDGNCLNDSDADGICDEEDPCIGAYDACGVCNGPGAIYDCGCTDIPDGDCDCDGNQVDAIGECGGSCGADIDNDGICDDVDECVGELDDCGVCNGSGSVYECGCSGIPEGDCDCEGNQLDVIGVCGGDCSADSDADGICDDVDPCVGQLDACGVCNGPGAIYECGCFDIEEDACDCEGNQLDALGECGGDCAADNDADGICDDVDPCVGAYDECGVCNGNGPEEGYDCAGTCLNDFDGDGVCDEYEVLGCGYEAACNYNPDVTEDDGSCTYPETGLNCEGDCLFDADSDGICDQDEVVGCQDSAACNYDASATDSGYCDYPETGYNCDGSCAGDADGDGVCDEFEIAGCTDASACNYNCDATDEAACSYAEYGLDCAGNCLIDSDADGVCDQDEVVGCSDEAACNYDPNATDDGYCGYAPELYDCDGNCLNDENGDGICDETQALIDLAVEEVYGDFVVALANGEYCGDGTVWLEELQLCVAIPTCMADLDNDGNRGTEDLLMLLSVYGTGCPLIEGCTNPEADNYNPLAEADDGTCVIPTCSGNSYTYAGHTYALVEIGDQCWFAENLKTNQFSNGDLIDEVNGGFDWYQSGADGMPARTIYNGLSVNANDFGYLYNGPVTLDVRGVCPTGWNVPSDEEWMMLEQHLGMDASDASNSGFRGTEEGDQLKALETDVPSWDGMNTVEFSALPAGYRFNFGSFAGISDEALFWSQTASGSSLWTRGLESGNAQIERTLKSGGFGASIRCLKSNENE